MIRLTAGNDTPFIWMVKLQGQPFDLSGKDVKVYVINSRGEIPVASLNIEGNRVSGVFEGRYQTRLGMHSLALRVNEGRPEMKTATVANAFELVQWSADAGGSEAGDVIFAPVVITSELRIGTGGGEGGGSYDDTAIWKAVNNKVDKVAGKGLSTNDYTNAEKSKLAGLKNYDDTKLKKEIADTYATKEYVDEAVANAGGGGEGCECATPDWNAEEGKDGHILNRTHYKDVEIYDSTFKYNEDGEALTPKYARLRDDYGNLSDLLPVSDDFEEFLDGFPLYDEYGDTTGYASGTLIVQPYNHTIRFDSDYEDEHYYVESVYESLKQLDEEFIPDTIARKSELTELREAIEDLDTGVAAHSEEIVNLQENKADKSELTELSAEVGKKQDTISDLATIREGAARGATALQSVPDTYATKTDVSNAIQTAITNELNADF